MKALHVLRGALAAIAIAGAAQAGPPGTDDPPRAAQAAGGPSQPQKAPSGAVALTAAESQAAAEAVYRYAHGGCPDEPQACLIGLQWGTLAPKLKANVDALTKPQEAPP